MALAVVRAIGEAGIPIAVLHYDARDFAHRSKYVVLERTIPDPLLDESGFIAAIVDAAGRFGGSLLVPASDEAMVAISRNLAQVEAHFVVAATEWAITERFIDKSLTAAVAEANGVPAPRTRVPASEEELATDAASIGFPLLLKPTLSHLFAARYGRKMIPVANFDELLVEYRRAVADGFRMMVQEIVEGADDEVVNYNAYVSDGTPNVEFTARQIRKAPPAFGSPRLVRSEWIPELIEPGRAILAGMQFHGFACVEFKRDRRDGNYKLIEVNGRHNLSALLAVRCGINFPLLQYRHLVDGVAPEGGSFREGFYWTDVVRDVAYSARFLARERHSPLAYVRPYAMAHADAIFDRRDMAPIRARVRYLMGLGKA